MGNGKNYNNNNNNKAKKSGARVVQNIDNPKGLFISAWKIDQGVMKSFAVNHAKKKGVLMDVTVSKNKKSWCPVSIKVTAPMQATVWGYGLMNLANEKVYIKDWNMIINPHAKNGGYCGKHISKDYND